MRLTEFWERMYRHFGETYAESFASDYVIEQLGSRTVRQALADGESAKRVWQGVCEAMEISARER